MTISTERAAALTLATNIVEKGTTAEAAIQVANKLLAYMLGDQQTAPAQQVSTPAKATTPPAATTGKTPAVTPGKRAATKVTPAEKPKPVEPEPPADPEAIDYTGPAGLEAVGAVVAQFIAANRRDEAINLLAEFDATAVSGVKPADREEFCNDGNALLAAGVDITK